MFLCCTSSNDDFGEEELGEDLLAWSNEFQKCEGFGLSMAGVQANHIMEDYFMVDFGSDSLFIGLYDGHGGHYTSSYIRKNFLPRLKQCIENQEISSEVLREIFNNIEEDFMRNVAEDYRKNPKNPNLVTVGSCCLVGFICRGMLHIANLGDSRAVMASRIGDTTILKAEQLTEDHHCSSKGIRLELRQNHQDDPKIVVKNGEDGKWRVKGIIQVTKTIGDAYLKRKPFEFFPKLVEVPKPFTRAVLSAEPDINSRVIGKNDRCLIFASHGFWEFMTNEEVVLVIERNPQRGIAKRLLGTALVKAAKAQQLRYNELRTFPKGSSRRKFHDDMTVIVLFLNQNSKRGENPLRRMTHQCLCSMNTGSATSTGMRIRDFWNDCTHGMIYGPGMGMANQFIWNLVSWNHSPT